MASKRILKELKDLQKDPPTSCSAGYPPEEYPKDPYPPPGYPPQGYPQGYPPPYAPYGQPPPQQQRSSDPGCMEGWKKTRKMAGLIQNSNTNATCGHSAVAMKKGGLTFSGRKSLDGLSNSGHPSLKEASEKMVTKKKISKADTGPRKILSDISNQASRKKHSIKLPAEPFNEKDIECGGLFHDHRKCIKAQNIITQHHMDHFPMTVGLVNGFPKELPFLERPESPPRLLEEMLEQPISDRSLDHSPPESPDYCKYWEDYCKYWEDRHNYVNFKLIDSSKLVKH